MKRRIIINVLLAFILLPVIIGIRDYIRIDVMHDHSVFYGSYFKYLSSSLPMLLLFMPVIFLLFILLPYNLIIVKTAPKRTLTLFQKVIIFELVSMTIFSLAGTFINLWLYPYWKNIYTVLYFLPLSILFATLIHLYVDRTVNYRVPQ